MSVVLSPSQSATHRSVRSIDQAHMGEREMKEMHFTCKSDCHRFKRTTADEGVNFNSTGLMPTEKSFREMGMQNGEQQKASGDSSSVALYLDCCCCSAFCNET